MFSCTEHMQRVTAYIIENLSNLSLPWAVLLIIEDISSVNEANVLKFIRHIWQFFYYLLFSIILFPKMNNPYVSVDLFSMDIE